MSSAAVPSLLLLIPAYNEEHRIEPVLRSYAAHFRANYPGEFQIVVVLNGCVDDTAGVVRRVARDYSEVNALEFAAPIGNTRGPLFVHSNGIVKRTHFHTMAMYANELEPRVGKLSLTADKLTHGGKSVPVADAIATVDETASNGPSLS